MLSYSFGYAEAPLYLPEPGKHPPAWEAGVGRSRYLPSDHLSGLPGIRHLQRTSESYTGVSACKLRLIISISNYRLLATFFNHSTKEVR